MDMSIMPEGLFFNSAKTCALQGFWMSRTSGLYSFYLEGNSTYHSPTDRG